MVTNQNIMGSMEGWVEAVSECLKGLPPNHRKEINDFFAKLFNALAPNYLMTEEHKAMTFVESAIDIRHFYPSSGPTGVISTDAAKDHPEYTARFKEIIDLVIVRTIGGLYTTQDFVDIATCPIMQAPRDGSMRLLDVLRRHTEFEYDSDDPDASNESKECDPPPTHYMLTDMERSKLNEATLLTVPQRIHVTNLCPKSLIEHLFAKSLVGNAIYVTGDERPKTSLDWMVEEYHGADTQEDCGILPTSMLVELDAFRGFNVAVGRTLENNDCYSIVML